MRISFGFADKEKKQVRFLFFIAILVLSYFILIFFVYFMLIQTICENFFSLSVVSLIRYSPF